MKMYNKVNANLKNFTYEENDFIEAETIQPYIENIDISLLSKNVLNINFQNIDIVDDIEVSKIDNNNLNIIF